MDSRRIRRIAESMIRDHKEPFIQSSGAQLAFYLIMSLVPLAILLVQACAVFAVSPDMVSDLAKDFLTPEALEYSKEALTKLLPGGVGSGSGIFSIVAVLTTLWSASKVQFCIVGICNYAYSGRTRVQGFVRERIRALVNVVLLILMTVASLVILVYGQVILNVIGALMREFSDYSCISTESGI